MKPYKNRIILILGIMLALLLSACESFTEVDLPSNQLTAEAVFQDPATADAALAAIYIKIRDTGFFRGGNNGLGSTMGCYTDELDFYGGATDSGNYFYTNNLLASNGTISSWWADAYQIIYSANAVIQGVAGSQGLSPEQKQSLTGEALFLRALVHFHLVNLYGPVPYCTTTDYRQNMQVSRTPTDQVYAQLIADLTAAVDALPEGYSNTEKVRANKAVARALLARVYLFNQNWAEAAQLATSVITDANGFTLAEDLDAVFLKESSETIWQLSPAAQGQNTEDGAHFIFTTTPPPTVALTSGLIAAFETGDLRKEHWTAALGTDQAQYYYAYKYKQRGLTSTSMEYQVLFRLAEQHLIRAEANIRLGNLSVAAADINLIRQRAGLSPTTAVSQQQLLDVLLHERRVELFTEQGHRFMDLKRFWLLEATLNTKPGWNTTDTLLPLPQNELLLNSNLSPQNPGY